MEGLTGAVALLGVVLVVVTRPAIGLVVYLSILLLFPDYLRLSLGTIDISATRIVASVLLIRCIASPIVMRRFRWITLDSLVALSMAVYAVTLAFTTPFDIWLENRGGYLMDTWFAYLVVRLAIADRQAFVVVLRALAVLVVPLALNALAEALSGWSVYAGLGQYCQWAPNRGATYQIRMGLNRAEGPYGEAIMFGLFFVTMVPLCWLLRYDRYPWNKLCLPLTGAAILGVACTISSGPYAALVVVLFCLFLQRARYLVKPLIVIGLVGCVGLEIVSNRHFYDVIMDRITFDAGNAWYRSELFEVAIKQLPEYWMVGYGFADPGWGPMIDGRNKTDGVNAYVVYSVVYGLPGLFAFVSVIALALRTVVRAYIRAPAGWLRAYAWSLGTALVGLMFAFWSVSLFTQLESLFYVLLALHGSAGTLVAGLRQGVSVQRHPWYGRVAGVATTPV